MKNLNLKLYNNYLQKIIGIPLYTPDSIFRVNIYPNGFKNQYLYIINKILKNFKILI